jgi:hypothetical protein
MRALYFAFREVVSGRSFRGILFDAAADAGSSEDFKKEVETLPREVDKSEEQRSSEARACTPRQNRIETYETAAYLRRMSP